MPIKGMGSNEHGVPFERSRSNHSDLDEAVIPTAQELAKRDNNVNESHNNVSDE